MQYNAIQYSTVQYNTKYNTIQKHEKARHDMTIGRLSEGEGKTRQHYHETAQDKAIKRQHKTRQSQDNTIIPPM
jgi:hypothetical protein